MKNPTGFCCALLLCLNALSTVAAAQQWRACKTLHSGACAVGRTDVPCPPTSAPIGGSYPTLQAACNAILAAQEPEDSFLQLDLIEKYLEPGSTTASQCCCIGTLGCYADHDCFGALVTMTNIQKLASELGATGEFEMLITSFRHPDAQKLFQMKG